jgi:hypothetical protein
LENFEDSELFTTFTPSLTIPVSQTRGRIPKTSNMIAESSGSESEPKTDDSEYKQYINQKKNYIVKVQLVKNKFAFGPKSPAQFYGADFYPKGKPLS